MKIIPVNRNQLSVISDLAKRIWPVSYANMISKDQIDYMLKLMYSMEELTKQHSNGHLFYNLINEDTPIGYIGLELKESILFVHKLYILPKEQGNAYGLKLLDHAKIIAKKLNCTHLRLNVNRNNKALSFYKRNGFNIINKLDIDIGGGYFMNDYQMEIEIS